MPQRRGLCWSAADVGDTRTRIVPSASPLGTADITPPGQMHGAAVTIFHPKIACCAGGGTPSATGSRATWERREKHWEPLK